MPAHKLPPLTQKSCKDCLAVKPISEFNATPEKPRGHRSRCKTCWADRCRYFRTKNKGMYLEREYNYKLVKKYGITREDYDYLLNLQGGVCAICSGVDGDKTREQRLSVDHCHKTGKIRGLLCNNCNRCLGMAKEDPKLLTKMIKYLGRI